MGMGGKLTEATVWVNGVELGGTRRLVRSTPAFPPTPEAPDLERAEAEVNQQLRGRISGPEASTLISKLTAQLAVAGVVERSRGYDENARRFARDQREQVYAVMREMIRRQAFSSDVPMSETRGVTRAWDAPFTAEDIVRAEREIRLAIHGKPSFSEVLAAETLRHTDSCHAVWLTHRPRLRSAPKRWAPARECMACGATAPRIFCTICTNIISMSGVGRSLLLQRARERVMSDARSQEGLGTPATTGPMTTRTTT